MQERQYDLKQVMALANMTHKDGAKLIHVHPVTFSKYVKDPSLMSLGQAHLLAEAAGIGVEQIET